MSASNKQQGGVNVIKKERVMLAFCLMYNSNGGSRSRACEGR